MLGAGSISSRPTSGPVVAHYLVLLARLKPASAPGPASSFDDTGQINQSVHLRSSNDPFDLRHYFKAKMGKPPE